MFRIRSRHCHRCCLPCLYNKIVATASFSYLWLTVQEMIPMSSEVLHQKNGIKFVVKFCCTFICYDLTLVTENVIEGFLASCLLFLESSILLSHKILFACGFPLSFSCHIYKYKKVVNYVTQFFDISWVYEKGNKWQITKNLWWRWLLGDEEMTSRSWRSHQKIVQITDKDEFAYCSPRIKVIMSLMRVSHGYLRSIVNKVDS
jgi:hypothetical protein